MGVFVIYAYVLVTILTGIAAMMKGAVLPGIAGIVGGGMSAWAGSGLKGSLVVGDAGQRIAGALMAALFVSAGTGLVYYSGFRIGLWGVDFSGWAWCIVGLCIAYLFTADKFAEGTGGSGSRRQKMVAAAILSLVSSLQSGQLILRVYHPEHRPLARRMPNSFWTRVVVRFGTSRKLTWGAL